MINFHSITIEAQELFNIFHSPGEIYVTEHGEKRDIRFQEGDCADVYLTDGSQYLIHHENGKWICRQFISRDPEIDDMANNGELVTLYGPYEELEEALVDLIADRVEDEGTRWEWAGRAITQGTANAFNRRLYGAVRHVEHLIRGDRLPAVLFSWVGHVSS
jgi:hypothetical protein